MHTNIKKIHLTLKNRYNNLNWWPVDKAYHIKNKTDPRFEIIIGAVLTQNTSWSNVEKALSNIKSKNMLDLKNISNVKINLLKELIKPSGFFNQKAKRLKEITNHINNNYNGNLDDFFKKEMFELRDELLSINGIGPETADSIILYAGKKPIFVVDAYTRRICERIPFDTKLSYDEIQYYFQKELSKVYKKDQLTLVYNQLHAEIVNLAKDYCRKKPYCDDCPLRYICTFE